MTVQLERWGRERGQGPLEIEGFISFIWDIEITNEMLSHIVLQEDLDLPINDETMLRCLETFDDEDL